MPANKFIERARERMAEIVANDDKAKRFDLTIWGNGLGEAHYWHEPETPQCGFAGCVIGWAAHEKWFEDMGVRIEFDPRVATRTGDIKILRNVNGSWVGRGDPTHSHTLADLFGMGSFAVEAIIMPENYVDASGQPTAAEVLERIDAYLAAPNDDTFVMEYHSNYNEEDDYVEDDYVEDEE